MIDTIYNQKIEDIINKYRLLGYSVKILRTAEGNNCYLLSTSDTEHILCIPDHIGMINAEFPELNVEFTKKIQKLKGTLKVIGGNHLHDAQLLFCGLSVQSLDLSLFCTDNIQNMFGMFLGCKAEYLDLTKFNTHNVTEMSSMFWNCKSKYIDLSSFDTSNVKCMTNIFMGCISEIKTTDNKLTDKYTKSR